MRIPVWRENSVLVFVFRFNSSGKISKHSNIFRRIDNCPSPWPCFVIAVREDFIEKNTNELKNILNIINNTTREFKDIPSIDKTIANHYEQQLSDVQEWLSITEWSQDLIDKETIMNVQKQLFTLNIIPEIVDYDTLISKI